ncbi:hypothetical protein BGW36DRAFT_453098 [Talaromyces proteolyticus]|uniref:Thioesterase domain-containing protein n=1 Tax=Talaromyces proteolyticus TaxID=1131652 RepID=A0AAD4KL71_9EURO|nr:uncharacterized protein BGW36DRAFT_453098 [Talaromyces proteolyticus]KAH8695209.1 hypothetical protein BGW36DRAFT_453098 [Talaromyces proteolyticus]
MDEVMLALAAVAFIWVATNAKGIPLSYTFQLLPSVYRFILPRVFRPNRELVRSSDETENGSSLLRHFTYAVPLLFQYYTTKSRVILADIDINLHKSNSTFFTDADISRATLLSTLLGKALADVGPATPVLASVQSKFLHEIRPYQAYWVCSRILAWNDKSLYTVTYFLRENMAQLPVEVDILGGGPTAVLRHDKLKNGVLAVLVTKYVFKAGRKTVPPEKILLRAGLLVEDDNNSHDNFDQDPWAGKREIWNESNIDVAIGHGLQYIRESMF